MSEACGCRICTGEIEDRPVAGSSECLHCDVPITYADTHRGAVVQLDYAGDGAALVLAHRRCLSDKDSRISALNSLAIFPRDAVKP